MTMCTYKQESLFEYDSYHPIIRETWDSLSDRYLHIHLDDFVIMPNHVHGILWIENVGAIHESPKARRSHLSKVVGYFKMNTSKQINILRGLPGIPVWQRNYYEHIIRSDQELNRIREYIQNNPLKWELDRENPDKIDIDEFDQWLYHDKKNRRSH